MVKATSLLIVAEMALGFNFGVKAPTEMIICNSYSTGARDLWQ